MIIREPEKDKEKNKFLIALSSKSHDSASIPKSPRIFNDNSKGLYGNFDLSETSSFRTSLKSSSNSEREGHA